MSFALLLLTGCTKDEMVTEHPFSQHSGQYQWLFTEARHTHGVTFQSGNSVQNSIISPQGIGETKTIVVQPDGTFQLFMGDSLAFESRDYDYHGSGLGHPYFPYPVNSYAPFLFSDNCIYRSWNNGTNNSHYRYREYWKKIE